jgi:hypothetical protein
MIVIYGGVHGFEARRALVSDNNETVRGEVSAGNQLSLVG